MEKLGRLKAPFPEKDIEWRLAQCGKKGGKFWGQALAYISARAVQDRLDEVMGPQNWKPSYIFLDKGVVCHLSLRIHEEWITKEDGSEYTDIEVFKGGISGAIKRAAVTWGIGRYLYSLESGFVTIVDPGTPGCYYGRTKDGEGFNWMPPRLPAWALPKSLGSVQGKPPETDANASAVIMGSIVSKPGGVIVNSRPVVPSRPEPNDGIVKTYDIDFGPKGIKDKNFEDCDAQKLESFIDEYEAPNGFWSKKRNVHRDEVIRKAKFFVESCKQIPPPEEHQSLFNAMDEKDVPF